MILTACASADGGDTSEVESTKLLFQPGHHLRQAPDLSAQGGGGRFRGNLLGHLPPETSDIVISVNSGETQYEAYEGSGCRGKLLDRFRDPKDPLKIIIVTSKLLTGFDARILQTMYLDKPLRDHTLFQAICRTNRPMGSRRSTA